jgi:hypothetical protein
MNNSEFEYVVSYIRERGRGTLHTILSMDWHMDNIEKCMFIVHVQQRFQMNTTNVQLNIEN